MKESIEKTFGVKPRRLDPSLTTVNSSPSLLPPVIEVDNSSVMEAGSMRAEPEISYVHCDHLLGALGQ